MLKTVVVLGGPNGAGKTTFARQLLLERLPDAFEFLNADLIAEGLSPFKPHKASMRAGREFLNRIDEKAKREESFVLESTLSGLSLAKRLSQLRSQGYQIELIYLWLPTADFAVWRVSERVKRGGHDIAENVIRRRFERSYLNFVRNYRDIVDGWVLLDGTKTPPAEIARWSESTSIEKKDPTHTALSKISDDGDSVRENVPEYGSKTGFYTENLDPILEAVGRFLRQQEEFEELVDDG